MSVTNLRDEFDDQFAALCAAFDRGYTSDRREAMRTAFVGKLSAAQVARIVERMVADGGPERMPTVRDMWQTWRTMRAPAPRSEPAKPQHVWPQWQGSANVCLITCAQRYPGRDSAAGWNLARRLGQQFQALADDGDARTFSELRAAIASEYERLPVAS